MAKLPKGVRKKENGSYEMRFTVNGKTYSVCRKKLNELEQAHKDKLKEIEMNAYIRSDKITLDEYFNEWIVNKRKNAKENTINHYTIIYNKHISNVIGKEKILKIEKRQIVKLQNDLMKSVSNKSNNHIIAILKIILCGAVKDDVIIKSPAETVELLKMEEEKEEAYDTYHRALTKEEQKLFMEEMKQDYYYEIVAFMLCTGVRVGEAAALRWQNVDLQNKKVHIVETVTCSENGKVKMGSPKTKAGKRDIPLNDEAIKILQRQRSKCKVLSFDKQTVFRSIYDTIVRSATVNKAIKEAIDRLDKKGIHVEHFTSHALRDTFATRFIEAGGNPKTLQKILGHKEFSMTVDKYVHVLEDTKENEMSKMEMII